MNELLERMWFVPDSDADPVFMVVRKEDQIWLTVEQRVPINSLLTLNLKREGFAPLYVQEVDLERDQAIVSLVMEC